MINETEQKRFMVQYLLGEVSAEECARFEDQYQADDELFQQLAAVENDIIDAYVRGKLSGSEREQFERHFLTNPERAANIKLARSLMQYVSGPEAAAVRSPGERKTS